MSGTKLAALTLAASLMASTHGFAQSVDLGGMGGGLGGGGVDESVDNDAGSGNVNAGMNDGIPGGSTQWGSGSNSALASLNPSQNGTTGNAAIGSSQTGQPMNGSVQIGSQAVTTDLANDIMNNVPVLAADGTVLGTISAVRLTATGCPQLGVQTNPSLTGSSGIVWMSTANCALTDSATSAVRLTISTKNFIAAAN